MAFTKQCLSSQLTLHGLRLPVHLGCSAEERLRPQFVRFDVTVRFSSLPEGCETDRLEQTVCYARLSEILSNVCQAREYQLIEKLGWDAFRAVREIIPTQDQLTLNVVKERPPVASLEGGASFTISEEV